jgi:sensor histidine kinase YesM
MEQCLKSNQLVASPYDDNDISLNIPSRFIIIFFFIVLSTGFVSYSRRMFNVVIHAEQMSRLHCIITDATGSIVSALLLSIVACLVYRIPIWKHNSFQICWRYILLAIIHSIFFILLSSILRYVGFYLFNLESLNPVEWGQVIQTEIPSQLFMLTVTIATVHGLLFFQRSNAEQVRVLQIEQQLTKEKLRSLQGQINPHFLFNTLNTISAIMYDDAKAADRMIERLGELLRASFNLHSMVEVPLKDELKLLEAYTSIMMDRFPNKFDIKIKCDADLNDILVPPLILQPLIENCFKHGRLDTLSVFGETGIIETIFTKVEDRLEITIKDNGNSKSQLLSSTIPQTSRDLISHGLGLNLTSKRLKLLYKSKGNLIAKPRIDQRGYEVWVSIPIKRGYEQGQYSPSPLPLRYPT